jgi:hypothetical protein
VSTDREELKRLAGLGIHHHPTATELKRLGEGTLALLAELEAAEAAVDRAVDIISSGCDQHGELTFDEFVDQGGNRCPICLRVERDQLRAEVERLREVAVTAWTDLFGGEPGEAVAKQLWDSVVSAVAGEEQSS